MVAGQLREDFGLVRRLNAFRRDRHVKFVGEHDDRVENLPGFPVVVVQCRDEGPVNLQFVEAELPEIAEAGLAGAEIVHRNRHSKLPQFAELSGVESPYCASAGFQ